MKYEDVKVGMKVVCTDSYSDYITKGNIYTVTRFDKTWVYVLKNDGVKEDGFNYRFFEPVLVQSQSSVSCKFHVGQPVRCVDIINPDSRLKLGAIYVVGCVGKHSLTLKDFPITTWTSRQFEPAYSLEVGCKVRVVGEHLYEGTEGIVISLPTELYPFVQFGNHFMEPKHLIVLEPAPKSKVLLFGTPSDDCVDALAEAYQTMVRESIQKNYAVGIDFAGEAKIYGTSLLGGQLERIKNHIKTFGGIGMENNDKKFKELAERMKDEYVGTGNRTVFLKKAGECSIEMRDVTMTLTVDDIETLLKQKGITKALGVHEIAAYSGTYTVGIIKFVPIKKDKSESNEAV